MELGFAKCESILNTLPIGYYTGRRINVSLDAEAKTSCYSTMEDKIVISYPIIAERARQMSEGANEEEAVRSMLYHEVSHAVLTPQNMYASTPVNIFEDERIESVLRHYYHGVDFRKQLYDLHSGHAPEPKNAEQAFYNAVRFGLGKGSIQKKISTILNKYKDLNRASRHYNWDGGEGPCYHDYVCEVDRLYREIADEWKDNPDQFKDQSGDGEENQMDSLQSGEGNSNGQKQERKKNSSEGQQEQEEGETRPQNIADERITEEMSAEQMKRIVGASLGKTPELDEEETMRLNEFQKTAEMIISNFNKKNKGGSGINAYSGVFNPRAVVRQDYRFFERSMTTQGNNKFGTCHLNLIIDCSGSYEYNVPLTNGILAVLSDIERKNRNFSMDVMFINHELHPCKTVRDRRMRACGGNAIPENMKEVLMGMQKNNTCNYNIILFDGDAMCNNQDCSNINDYRKRFEVFDMKQTTLISDPDNEDYMKNFTSTKMVITQEYTKELIKNITHALTIAFG